MKKTKLKISKTSIIIYIFCSLFIYSCENKDDFLQKKENAYNSKIRKESLSKGNGIVSETVALDIATKFNPKIFFDQNNKSNLSKKISNLNGNNKIKNKFIINDSNGIPAFYIFNFDNNQGFVFVSADYKMQPILAFIETGEFIKDSVPSGLLQWLDKTIENIGILRSGKYDNSNDATHAWDNYYSQNSSKLPPYNPCDTPDTSFTIGPLLNVTWGQGYSYNELCPDLSCNNWNNNAYTGCVATATAQVIRYWHPANQYNYNYNYMTSNYGNYEVQKLMRDIGLPINVNMDYGCSSSSADGDVVANALKTNFGFSSANNVNYDYQRVNSNINAYQPVLLTGCRTSTSHYFIINWYNTYSNCHQWVCDGSSTYNYNICENGQWLGGGSYLYFHMNWGWHEYGSTNDYNGWFAFSNWNIPEINYNYQYAKGLTSEIHP